MVQLGRFRSNLPNSECDVVGRIPGTFLGTSESSSCNITCLPRNFRDFFLQHHISTSVGSWLRNVPNCTIFFLPASQEASFSSYQVPTEVPKIPRIQEGSQPLPSHPRGLHMHFRSSSYLGTSRPLPRYHRRKPLGRRLQARCVLCCVLVTINVYECVTFVPISIGTLWTTVLLL